jgi:hypothetical protein
LVVAGCSSFNLSPKCEETHDGLRRILVVQGPLEKPDFSRLRAIIGVSQSAELASDYNKRTCSAVVETESGQARATYTVTQAEGAQSWYEIVLVNDTDSELAALVADARKTYYAR